MKLNLKLILHIYIQGSFNLKLRLRIKQATVLYPRPHNIVLYFLHLISCSIYKFWSDLYYRGINQRNDKNIFQFSAWDKANLKLLFSVPVVSNKKFKPVLQSCNMAIEFILIFIQLQYLTAHKPASVPTRSITRPVKLHPAARHLTAHTRHRNLQTVMQCVSLETAKRRSRA